MKRHLLKSFVYGGSALALLLAATPASAVKLFTQTDNILAIDLNNSRSPGAEGPDKIVDQVFVPGPPVSGTTKYLNFSKEQSGFIVTPVSGPSTIQSLQMRAANDAEARDPMTYELYGTNDTINSWNNSFGDQESWTLIGSGDTGLAGLTGPENRHQLGTVQDIANGVEYTSYKMVFPTIRDTLAMGADSMQVADVQFFTAPAGGGSAVLATGDAVVGITHDTVKHASAYPAAENPALAFDGTPDNKYLNFGRANSGVIVSRADGLPTIVESLTFVTAHSGGEQGRDPLTWVLYGTLDPVTSMDNSNGSAESWVQIDTGVTGFADPNIARNTAGGIQLVDNAAAYNAYRLVFPSIRNPNELMQIGDIVFEGQVVPEPSTFVMVGLAVTAFGLVARRRNTRSA